MMTGVKMVYVPYRGGARLPICSAVKCRYSSRARPRACHGPLQLADVPRLLQAQGVISRGVGVRPVQRSTRAIHVG
jgi:hypothetical protein